MRKPRTKRQAFNWKINVAHSLGNALGAFLTMYALGQSMGLTLHLQQVMWAVGIVYGLAGGSLSDLISYVRNNPAQTPTPPTSVPDIQEPMTPSNK